MNPTETDKEASHASVTDLSDVLFDDAEPVTEPEGEFEIYGNHASNTMKIARTKSYLKRRLIAITQNALKSRSANKEALVEMLQVDNSAVLKKLRRPPFGSGQN